LRRIVVVGHAALDHVYRVETIPTEPRKIRALEHIEGGGGMAANAAAAIARLGGAVELWSRTGADGAGQLIRSYLEADQVDIRYVKAFESARSSTSAILVDGKGERLIVGERDHAMSMDASWLPLERIDGARAVLSDLRWFEATRAAFARARKAGVPTVLDADFENDTLMRELLALTDYAIFPVAALEVLMPGESLDARLEGVVALGPYHAGVTQGAKGYLWRNRKGQSGYCPAFKVAVVDTTGAGDAFHGAFTWALAWGLDEAQCARIASAAAAMKCRRLGARAGLPTLAELEAFLSEDLSGAAQH
jgi:sulfofructose kinase